jgi:hypothetical protein
MTRLVNDARRMLGLHPSAALAFRILMHMSVPNIFEHERPRENHAVDMYVEGHRVYMRVTAPDYDNHMTVDQLMEAIADVRSWVKVLHVLSPDTALPCIHYTMNPM